MANILRCKKCGDIITSDERHDMNWCKCGAIAIDGGDDYCKITGNPEDMEVFVPSKLLTEKEKDFENLKFLFDLVNNPKGQHTIRKVDQDKISFAIKRIENLFSNRSVEHINHNGVPYINKEDLNRIFKEELNELKSMLNKENK